MDEVKDEAITDNVVADDKPNDLVVDDKKYYSDSQIDELMKPLKDEIDRLNSVISDKTVSKEEIEYQNRLKELWNKEVAIELKMEGLSDFSEFFDVEENNREELEAKIAKFKCILGKRDLNDGFVPEGHRQTDKYSLAEKSKDTKAMIGTKLFKLFK